MLQGSTLLKRRTNCAHRVDSCDNGQVKIFPLPEKGVQGYFTNLRPHRGLCKLGNGELRILNTITGLERIDDAEIENTVDIQVHIICKIKLDEPDAIG